MRHNIVGLTVLSLIVVGHPGKAQELTIPERAARMAPAGYVVTKMVDFAPIAFADAVRDADLIVRASLRKLNVYLSSDQFELFTDYEVRPIEVVSSRRTTTAKSAGLQQIILRQWGGETTVNDLPVKISVEGFPPLPVDTPLLLLLSFNTEIQKYEVVDRFAGAFAIDSKGKLRHLLKQTGPSYERLNGADTAKVIAEIRELRRQAAAHIPDRSPETAR